MRSFLLFATLIACGDKDTSDTAPEADTDTDSDTDTDTDSDADTDTDTDTDTSGEGEGVFATVTVDGEVSELACPYPDEDTSTPYLINFYAGDVLSFGCARDQQIGAYGPVVGLTFGDREALAGGAIDESSGGGMSVKIGGESSSTTSSASNFESLSVSGTFDAGTRRLVGTFSASWGAPNASYEIPGSVSGSFDLVLIEEE